MADLFLYLILFTYVRKYGLNHQYTKYLLLGFQVLIFSCVHTFLTYHTLLTIVIPIICAAQYRDNRVIWITYAMSSVGILASTLIGYRVGLCDANILLLTQTNTADFMKHILAVETIIPPTYFQIILYYVFPRCVVVLCVIPIVIHIKNEIDQKSADLLKSQEENLKLYKEHQEVQRSVITSLSSVIASRDETTGYHIQNTALYVEFITKKLLESGSFGLQLDEEYAENIIHAAPLHDVGKIKIPDSILCKPGKLNPGEFEMIKLHTIYGKEVMDHFVKTIDSNNEYLTVAKQMAIAHHERFDGKGYPYGKKGNDIPLCARIMSVADVLDALLSKRQYKDAMKFDTVYRIMAKEADKQFDDKVLRALLDNWDEFVEEIYPKSSH
ncbi:MAG: HD domain-containing phosphohydrolase [Erysipelotrichaceae bacterium]|nr:HD domain-containing phosphohydrolase [Erysipelotrichaceae bacterium]